ncbi:uncharacterized protein BJ212DRAFT_1356368 [Suillus subaureus]|uniref:Uncharacterized protein n=1 Tax=Suillus subaureus TaxID=48587 RepID=A0A9P7EAK5_9AGAM|nr:uncharacterized protein BJ212DRAFT_1356368 [Suillus subaureus]KAG1816094.1 hypothetical protein BJ212DRAFT_1356368 [Suillus subaureus]
MHMTRSHQNCFYLASMEQEHVSPPRSELTPGVVPRFVRSFSKASATTEQSTPTAHADAQEASSPSTSKLPKAKINTIDKLLKYARKAKRPGFPPSSWLVEEGNQGQQPITPTAASLPAPPIIDDEIQEAGSSATADVIQFDAGEVGVESEPPEADTLARKIQAMIASLPSMPSGLPTSFPPFHTTPSGTPVIDSNDNPPSPGFSDSKLMTFLTSFTVMNGSVDRGRESVWSVLDRLRSPLAKSDSTAEPNVEEPRTGAEYEDDNGSVMMYGPLEPTEDSEIEIARSEIVSHNGDGEEIRTPQLTFVPLPSESIEQVLAQSESSDRRKGKQRAGSEQVTSSSRVEPGDTTAVGVIEQVEYRVWLPSPTKISIQAMWWGFRIYLPPPVLDALNDKQLEAAKRAALITTALKWLLDHLPISLMPPQLRTPMSFLRRLVPYLGYIGGFIAWSWSAVKVFDKGYGIVLTATWLLPIALIPGTWEATDFPALQAEPQTPAWSKY